MWAKIPDQLLINQSTIIVKAELIGTTVIQLADTNKPLHVGVLQIQRIYKGSTELKILLLALPIIQQSVSNYRMTITHNSSDIHYTVGQNGIWLLRENSKEKGIYYADNPQRFWSNQQEKKLLQLISNLGKN